MPIFSTKIRKYLIVRKATIHEVKKPTTKEIILIWVSYRTKSPIKKTSSQKIHGTTNKTSKNSDEVLLRLNNEKTDGPHQYNDL